MTEELEVLNVLTPDELNELIAREFKAVENGSVKVGLDRAFGRILAEDITAEEYVPDFNRSTVDGYALRASDTFGCTEAIPAILSLRGEVLMGEAADFELPAGSCCYVPTGGEIPEGADCTVMIEYTEDYGDGTIGILKPGAPGANMIFRGDDVYPGKVILHRGRKLTAPDIGALAACGTTQVPVAKAPVVGIISTGDELVEPEETPGPGQVRDVNSPMLAALYRSCGAEVISFGIVRDDRELLREAVVKALDVCDMVILSGGSSVGVKDATCEIIQSLGELLLHGIAIKPGKPTIMGKCGGKPVVGLPGHPVAAYYIAKLFTVPILNILTGALPIPEVTAKARLMENIGANHGRAQINAVRINEGNAEPVRFKSGLISSLAGTDGFIIIDRDCEGLGKDSEVEIHI